MSVTRSRSTVLGCLLCAALIAACGSDNSDGSGSQAASVPATVTGAQTTAPATSTAPTQPAEPAQTPPTHVAPPSGAKPGGGAPAKVVVPDVVGQSLADAQAALGQIGLSFRAEAKSGDRTQIRSDWEVCKTVPAGGKRAPRESPIALITAAPGGC